jgi:hypothetical protein
MTKPSGKRTSTKTHKSIDASSPQDIISISKITLLGELPIRVGLQSDLGTNQASMTLVDLVEVEDQYGVDARE